MTQPFSRYAPCCRAYMRHGWEWSWIFLQSWVRSYLHKRVAGHYDAWKDVDRNGLGASLSCVRWNLRVLWTHRCPWHGGAVDWQNYLAVMKAVGS